MFHSKTWIAERDVAIKYIVKTRVVERADYFDHLATLLTAGDSKIVGIMNGIVQTDSPGICIPALWLPPGSSIHARPDTGTEAMS